MRLVQDVKLELGEIDIAKIKIDDKSRDDVPQILRGLQYLYTTDETREKLFTLLEQLIPQNIDPNNGRPGMHLWRIFVLGTLRISLNIDYDRLHDYANQHRTVREMLGHTSSDETYYHCQTLKDNIKLFTPEILAEINELVVNTGHKILKKNYRTRPYAVEVTRLW
jgi:hypothetical protein